MFVDIFTFWTSSSGWLSLGNCSISVELTVFNCARYITSPQDSLDNKKNNIVAGVW
jgi:hypothetical protein